MKILHVSHHRGCVEDLNYVASKIGVHIETLYANWNYNVGEDRARKVWDEHADYFKSFDVIITSDTAPLSRIFLQNNYQGKLIIWICNRFDYYDGATNDCGFPDPGYYELLRNSLNNKKVVIAGYAPYENIYARQKGIPVNDFFIRPVAGTTQFEEHKIIPVDVKKDETFFIPPYHNDTIYMNLSKKCSDLGIKNYNGRYNGYQEIKDFKGVIHIPYAWSNLVLFEGIHFGVPFLIPSKRFLVELSRLGNFYWTPPFQIDLLDYAEWYHKDFSDLFIYFESWEDLREKTITSDLSSMRAKRLSFSSSFEEQEIKKWKEVIGL